MVHIRIIRSKVHLLFNMAACGKGIMLLNTYCTFNLLTVNKYTLIGTINNNVNNYVAS